jgi:CoA:oxalate CoA-transferase
VARADVLIENFRPGVMQRLGYGWDELHARHPRLVMASCSGFGQTGPYAKRPAYDIVVQAMGGIMSLTGHPGGEPTRVGTSMGDMTAGLFTTIGIQAAIIDRERTGEGRFVDVAMLDSQVATLENAIARFAATGQAPGPLGSRHPSIAPFEALASSDGYLVVAAGNDALFATLCDTLGSPELATDPRFVTNALRSSNVDALQAELETILSRESTATWIDRLQAAGVPCGPLNDVEAVLADPQVRARNMVVAIEGDGALELAGNPIKLSGVSDPTTRRPAPELDADRVSIIAELEADRDPSTPGSEG